MNELQKKKKIYKLYQVSILLLWKSLCKHFTNMKKKINEKIKINVDKASSNIILNNDNEPKDDLEIQRIKFLKYMFKFYDDYNRENKLKPNNFYIDKRNEIFNNIDYFIRQFSYIKTQLKTFKIDYTLYNQLNEEINKNEKEIYTLENNIKQFEIDIRKLKNEEIHLNTQVDDLYTKKKNLEREISAIDIDIQRQPNTFNRDQSNPINELRVNLQDRKKNLDETINELNNEKRKLEEIKNELKITEKKKEDLDDKKNTLVKTSNLNDNSSHVSYLKKTKTSKITLRKKELEDLFNNKNMEDLLNFINENVVNIDKIIKLYITDGNIDIFTNIIDNKTNKFYKDIKTFDKMMYIPPTNDKLYNKNNKTMEYNTKINEIMTEYIKIKLRLKESHSAMSDKLLSVKSNDIIIKKKLEIDRTINMFMKEESLIKFKYYILLLPEKQICGLFVEASAIIKNFNETMIIWLNLEKEKRGLSETEQLIENADAVEKSLAEAAEKIANKQLHAEKLIEDIDANRRSIVEELNNLYNTLEWPILLKIKEIINTPFDDDYRIFYYYIITKIIELLKFKYYRSEEKAPAEEKSSAEKEPPAEEPPAEEEPAEEEQPDKKKKKFFTDEYEQLSADEAAVLEEPPDEEKNELKNKLNLYVKNKDESFNFTMKFYNFDSINNILEFITTLSGEPEAFNFKVNKNMYNKFKSKMNYFNDFETLLENKSDNLQKKYYINYIKELNSKHIKLYNNIKDIIYGFKQFKKKYSNHQNIRSLVASDNFFDTILQYKDLTNNDESQQYKILNNKMQINLCFEKNITPIQYEIQRTDVIDTINIHDKTSTSKQNTKEIIDIYDNNLENQIIFNKQEQFRELVIITQNTLEKLSKKNNDVIKYLGINIEDQNQKYRFSNIYTNRVNMELEEELNLIIRKGWNYYSTICESDEISTVDKENIYKIYKDRIYNNVVSLFNLNIKIIKNLKSMKIFNKNDIQKIINFQLVYYKENTTCFKLPETNNLRKRIIKLASLNQLRILLNSIIKPVIYDQSKIANDKEKIKELKKKLDIIRINLKKNNIYTIDFLRSTVDSYEAKKLTDDKKKKKLRQNKFILKELLLLYQLEIENGDPPIYDYIYDLVFEKTYDFNSDLDYTGPSEIGIIIKSKQDVIYKYYIKENIEENDLETIKEFQYHNINKNSLIKFIKILLEIYTPETKNETDIKKIERIEKFFIQTNNFFNLNKNDNSKYNFCILFQFYAIVKKKIELSKFTEIFTSIHINLIAKIYNNNFNPNLYLENINKIKKQSDFDFLYQKIIDNDYEKLSEFETFIKSLIILYYDIKNEKQSGGMNTLINLTRKNIIMGGDLNDAKNIFDYQHFIQDKYINIDLINYTESILNSLYYYDKIINLLEDNYRIEKDTIYEGLINVPEVDVNAKPQNTNRELGERGVVNEGTTDESTTNESTTNESTTDEVTTDKGGTADKVTTDESTAKNIAYRAVPPSSDAAARKIAERAHPSYRSSAKEITEEDIKQLEADKADANATTNADANADAKNMTGDMEEIANKTGARDYQGRTPMHIRTVKGENYKTQGGTASNNEELYQNALEYALTNQKNTS